MWSYKLSALLGQANDATSAELASVLEHCNKISAILDPALTIFEKEHPTQGTALRQALGCGIARAIQGPPPEPKVGQDKTYAATAVAEGSSPKKPPVAIPANGQPHKRQVQRTSRPSHQGAEDKRVMIRLPKAHPARDLDPRAIRERMRALVPEPTWISDAWHCPSGITLAVPSPAKAASILGHASQLQTAIGASCVERQESWATFVVGPIKRPPTVLMEKTSLRSQSQQICFSLRSGEQPVVLQLLNATGQRSP
ncbi:hypothetical protein ACJ73_06205 [Blastomyces percursus]|uniref:Uncharacterized protein n=1 Tax=Blastomyces percursus TaxID=1658174 RepID=A0A1J9R497_9EURO|nr:hypothetical protein ACJ73_06205 [Blastomyces percursus]